MAVLLAVLARDSGHTGKWRLLLVSNAQGHQNVKESPGRGTPEPQSRLGSSQSGVWWAMWLLYGCWTLLHRDVSNSA